MDALGCRQGGGARKGDAALKIGRSTKLTSEVQKIIVETLRVGATFTAAAGRAGVAESTIHKWRQAGKGNSPSSRIRHSKRLEEFALAVDRALADAETRLVGTVNKASSQQWQAAAWLLERRWAGQYGRRDHLEMDATVTQRPPREEMDAELDKIRERLTAKGG